MFFWVGKSYDNTKTNVSPLNKPLKQLHFFLTKIVKKKKKKISMQVSDETSTGTLPLWRLSCVLLEEASAVFVCRGSCTSPPEMNWSRWTLETVPTMDAHARTACSPETPTAAGTAPPAARTRGDGNRLRPAHARTHADTQPLATSLLQFFSALFLIFQKQKKINRNCSLYHWMLRVFLVKFSSHEIYKLCLLSFVQVCLLLRMVADFISLIT